MNCRNASTGTFSEGKLCSEMKEVVILDVQVFISCQYVSIQSSQSANVHTWTEGMHSLKCKPHAFLNASRRSFKSSQHIVFESWLVSFKTSRALRALRRICIDKDPFM